MIISRRTLLQSAIAAGTPMAFIGANAQSDWPMQPVKLIVPFTAGGASDVLTRLLAEKLQAKLGSTWIIDNRTGAGGNIGMEAVKNASPDGYTIASATVGDFKDWFEWIQLFLRN